MENKNAALKWSSEDGNESFILSVTDKLNRSSVKIQDYRLSANSHEETYSVDLTKNHQNPVLHLSWLLHENAHKLHRPDIRNYSYLRALCFFGNAIKPATINHR